MIVPPMKSGGGPSFRIFHLLLYRSFYVDFKDFLPGGVPRNRREGRSSPLRSRTATEAEKAFFQKDLPCSQRRLPFSGD
jgi:hypothetical protein